jgi:thiol-disulfide isomerase/thioredoxin
MKTSLVLFRSLVLTGAAVISAGTAHSQFQPVNDMFANRTVITGTNIVTYGLSVNATKEAGEPDHADDVGGASIWWSWQAPMSGLATISTAGSNFDTLLGVYTGSSVADLTTVASDDDDPDTGALTSKVGFMVASNQIYQIAVDGYDGESGTVTLTVLVAPPTPPPPPPKWWLPDPYGSMVTSTSFAGKVVIVDFWATWCNPCKAGMPDLVALQEKYRADGLAVVGANVSWSGDSSATVASFLATFTPTINYRVVMSDVATDSLFGGIAAIPTTFIIDRQNLIQKKYVGTQSYSTLESQIIPLLYNRTQIGCQRSGNQTVLCWPTNALGFTLQSASNLAAPIWTDWPTAPTLVNGQNTLQVPMTASPCYFRLRLNN